LSRRERLNETKQTKAQTLISSYKQTKEEKKSKVFPFAYQFAY
jgi:hypothetical protein